MKRIFFYLLVVLITANAVGRNADTIFLYEDIEIQKDSLKKPDLNDIFILLTSDTVLTPESTAKGPEEAIYRCEFSKNDILPCLESGLSYVLRSKLRNFYVSFSHFNCNLDSLRKIREPGPNDKMKILTLSRDFLSKVEPIDMDKEFPKIKDRKDALEWEMRLLRKRVWIIDRRYMTDNTMILVETRINFQNHGGW